MNTRNMHFLPAITMLAICAVTAAQDGPPASSEEWPIVHQSCRVANFPQPGLSTYTDKVDGFQFKYPSALQTEGSWPDFDNSTCVEFFKSGESIRVEVSLPDAFEKPVWVAENRGFSGKIVINQMEWMNYADQELGTATYCTYHEHEQVCILGVDTSLTHRLSYNLMRTMREIESTLVFTDVTDRLDSRIAAVKVGDRFGSLRVRRVVTREMANRRTGGHYGENLGSYGEIDFSGFITMTGSLDDLRTMNSGPNWMFSPNAEISTLLSCDLCKDLSFQIQFRNNDFGIEQREGIPSRRFGLISSDADLTLVVNNISAIFFPMSGASQLRASIVRIVKNH